MAVITADTGTLQTVTISGLGTLAASTYIASSTISLNTSDPLDMIIQLSVTPGTVAGNKLAAVYIQSSLDNSTFSTGPTSGTSTTDDANLNMIGILPLNSNGVTQTKHFSVAAALGWIPPYVKIVIRNDSGTAFTAASCGYALITGSSV